MTGITEFIRNLSKCRERAILCTNRALALALALERRPSPLHKRPAAIGAVTRVATPTAPPTGHPGLQTFPLQRRLRGRLLLAAQLDGKGRRRARLVTQPARVAFLRQRSNTPGFCDPDSMADPPSEQLILSEFYLYR